MTQTPSQFEALQASHDHELALATRRHRLLSDATACLDRTCAAPSKVYDHGYCADVSLYFDGASIEVLNALMEAYPPEPLVLVRDGALTQKPLAYVRDHERDNATILELAPVLYKANARARCADGESCIYWWTRLNSSLMAQLQVRQATMGLFQALFSMRHYELDSHSYSTGSTTFGRRTLKTLVTEKPAEDAWLESWNDFAAQQGYYGAQRSFLIALRQEVMQPRDDRIDWRTEGLPEPRYDLAGTALAIPEGREMLEYLEEQQKKAAARKEHWLDRVGDFRRHFDREAAEKLWNFCLAKAEEWPRARAEDRRQAQETAQALETLLQRGMPGDDIATMKHLRHALEAATGRTTRFRIATQHADGRLELDIENRHRFTIRANTARTLRPQDLPVQYAD